MHDLLEQVEKEANKTKNDLIVNLCARIRKLFPEWLSVENIDSYIQEELYDVGARKPSMPLGRG